MSLINDALKRASQAQPPPPPKETEPPMRPVSTTPPAVWPYATVSVLLAGIVGVAIWFFAQAYQSSRDTALQHISVPVAAREGEPEPTASSEPVVATQAVTTAVTSNAPVVASNEVAAVEPPKPSYKLQGIFYRPSRPVAMVNGKSLTVGERVSGARVVSITSQSVTLDVQGQKTVLTLEQ